MKDLFWRYYHLRFLQSDWITRCFNNFKQKLLFFKKKKHTLWIIQIYNPLVFAAHWVVFGVSSSLQENTPVVRLFLKSITSVAGASWYFVVRHQKPGTGETGSERASLTPHSAQRDWCDAVELHVGCQAEVLPRILVNLKDGLSQTQTDNSDKRVKDRVLDAECLKQGLLREENLNFSASFPTCTSSGSLSAAYWVTPAMEAEERGGEVTTRHFQRFPASKQSISMDV